ncbi:MAG: LacI family DNA-binding transcriptional regulator [Rhizobiales bacterium]|nr:LacI family DNA-binding transcriptional regulator [Hyphomicrobiales bacterium]
MSAKAVKLADVAKAAGVSQGTASNVFSRPELVRAEVRARVEETARQLGYRGPDPRGRLLRAGKVNAIGVVVSDDLTYFFNDPFNREFMIGLASACDERGAGVSLISAANRATAAWSVETALVDGFIVQCMEDGDRLVELARKRGLPFVACDIDPGGEASSIRIDDRGGARMAAEHLLALGHRRFAILSLELRNDGRVGLVDRARRVSAEYAGTRDRLLGYGDAFAKAGIDIDTVAIVEAFNDPAGAAEGAAALLDAARDATAVLAMSDVAAIALLAEAKRRGIAVPQQLSVIGFDDVPEAAASSPRLTTIRQPIREKGRRAGALILAGGETRHELLPVQLIVRGTTAAPFSA